MLSATCTMSSILISIATTYNDLGAQGYGGLRKFLEEDADVQAKDSDGRTPLYRAAEDGHDAVVKLLLDTGKVDVDSKDSDGRTPLSRAAHNGHDAVVKLLRSIS